MVMSVEVAFMVVVELERNGLGWKVEMKGVRPFIKCVNMVAGHHRVVWYERQGLCNEDHRNISVDIVIRDIAAGDVVPDS